MKKVTKIFILLILTSFQMIGQTFEFQIIKDDLKGSNGIIYYDFNEDGIKEYIVARYSQDVVTLVYQEDSVLIEKDLISVDQPNDLEIGDFNQDGKMDIALTASNIQGIRILRNLGNLEFSVQTLNVFDFENAGALAASDLDNDGDLDLAVSSYTSDQLAIFEMKNPDFFSFNVHIIDNDSDIREISIGDLNNDGNSDVVASNRFGNKVEVYFNNGNLNFNKLSMQLSGAVDNSIADFNNDGLPDIAVTSFSNSDLFVFLNNGNNTFTEVLVDGSVQSADAVECFDINLDGIPDIVVGNNEGIVVFLIESIENGIHSREDYLFDGWVGPFDIVDVDEDSDFDVVASSTALPGIIHYNNLSISISDNDNDGFNSDEDCDDDNPNVNPGQDEVVYNGLDDDCNPETLDDDLDQDGFLLIDDCDDTNPNINPDAQEIPDNGIDEDCDGEDETTSTYEIGNSLIKIFPNPVSSELQILVEGNLEYELKLYDLQGKVVFNKYNCSTIEVTDLAVGTYIVEIQDLKSIKKIVTKIVVER